MNIAITGINGFVGKQLSNYLLNYPSLNVVPINLRENLHENILSNIDIVIHLAGKAHDLKRSSDPEEYYRVNYGLTKQLYDEFIKSNATKFIFISSVKASADNFDGLLTEQHKPDPKTDYGKSKLFAEEYIQTQPLPTQKSYYILRPCMIHGPGNKGNLNLLYQFVKKGIPYPLAAFNNKRSFLSVENLCFIINELLVRNDISSGVYQIADDDALSTNDVVSILASSLNTKPKLWKLSPAIIKLIAKFGDVAHLPLTTERLIKLTESYIVSNQKIKNVLNKELPVTAVTGLKITANSFNKD